VLPLTARDGAGPLARGTARAPRLRFVPLEEPAGREELELTPEDPAGRGALGAPDDEPPEGRATALPLAGRPPAGREPDCCCLV
jgi:hypothetical protein